MLGSPAQKPDPPSVTRRRVDALAVKHRSGDEPDMQADAPASLRYWCHVHRRIADLKEREPDRTLIVSFDQLCQDPSLVMPKIFEFAGVDTTPELVKRLLAGVRPPSSIGRHLKEDLSVFDPDDIAFVKPFMATIEMS